MAEDATTEDVTAEDAPAQVEDQRAPYVHPEGARDFRIRDEPDGPAQDARDFIGVTEEYRTYANHYDAPILTDTERFVHTNQYDHLTGNVDEAPADEVPADDKAPLEGPADEVEVEKTRGDLPPVA